MKWEGEVCVHLLPVTPRRICAQPDCQELESGGQGQGGGVGFWTPGGPRLVQPSPSISGAVEGMLWMGCAWGSQGCR